MKRCLPVLLIILILCSCSPDSEVSQLTENSFAEDASEEISKEPEYKYIRKEGQTLKGMWISQYDITDIWCTKEGQTPETEFASAINNLCRGLKEKGYNALFVQVRPFGDSFYPSAYYSPSKFAVGAYDNYFIYDPLKLFIDCAHTYGLEFHAWVNPYRLIEEAELDLIPDDALIKQYAAEGRLALHGGRYYFRPSDEVGRNTILNGIVEIIENYDVDGIHFDDYFYPTKEPAFDADDFAASGETDLYEWRRNNVNILIGQVYNTVKAYDPDCIFGISPAGNMSYTYDYCCADVYTWCNTPGYVDYILPQLYFGYKHPDVPFTPTLEEWQSIIKLAELKLYIGLAMYKQGVEDVNAGEARNEWIEDDTMLYRQQADCEANTDGFVMFSYSYMKP